MRFIFLSALKDLRRLRHEPLTLATWVGIPLLVAVLLVAFFGREQPKPQGLVLIADQDNTLVSALVMHAYTQDKLGDMFTVQQVPVQEGRRRIGSGDGSALVIIPKGFSRAVLGRQEAKIQLITNPSQGILPGIVESVTSVLVEGVWRLQQLVGDDLRRYSGNEEPKDADIAAQSIRYRHLATDLRKYLDPPVIKLTVETIEPKPRRAQINISEAMFPSMTFLALMLVAFGTANDIWKEKMNATLRRAAVTRGSIAGFLGGKVLALWIVFALIGVVALLSGKFLVGLESRNPVLAVLWLAAGGGTMYMFLVLLNTFFSNPRGATMISNFLVMILAMLGGSFFPLDIMPDSLARIGRWTPNGMAMQLFRDILAGQFNHAGLVTAFAAAIGLTVLLLAAAAWRLRWKFIF
jgi:hypothetical protein